MQDMIKALLADRFHLQFHRETREIPTYWGIRNLPHSIEGWKETVPMLVGFLGGDLDKPILDKTGLDGKYDFKLDWSEDIRSPDAGGESDLSKPLLFAALQEQLGLKLEAHPGPVEFFVIDHAERPDAN